MAIDYHWKPLFENFLLALENLERTVGLDQERELTQLEIHGLIQEFECIHELAMKILKEHQEQMGVRNIIGSKDIVSSAIKKKLIGHDEYWMTMLMDRSHALHAYSAEIASEIAMRIIGGYEPAFREMADTFKAILQAAEND